MNEQVGKPEVDREIATTQDGRDITRGYTGDLLLPYDRILRGRGGNDLAIYEQVLSDPQVKTVLAQRLDAVVQAPWQVDAGGDRPIDEEAAAFVRLQLERIGWDSVSKLMGYGVFYGFSAAEVIWDYQAGRWGWGAIKVRNRRRFRFGKDMDLRLLTGANMYPGEAAPAPYFWHFATGADNHDEPYGLGLAHWLYWPVLFKRNGIKFWLTFLEKFAGPTAVGRYDANATDTERARLLAACRAIQTDAGIILPKGMELSLLEATRGGTADYQVLHDTMDETIAKVVLGQTMTTEDGSSESQANVHKEVRQDIVKADADLICESFNLGPVRWLCEFNFPGAALPRVYRMLEEEEDLDKKADTDLKIQKLGYKSSLDYVQETYGEHWEQGPAPTATADAVPVETADAVTARLAEFADPDDPLAPERSANRERQQLLADAAVVLAAPSRRYVGSVLHELQVLIDETQDLGAFRDRLVELADREPNEEFVQALARAGFGAQLLARTPRDA